MKETGLDGRHRDKDGGISKKHGNTLVGTLRKIYGKGFAAGYPDATQLSEVQLLKANFAQPQPNRPGGTDASKVRIGQPSIAAVNSSLAVVTSTAPALR